jgi:hypothetical protein
MRPDCSARQTFLRTDKRADSLQLRGLCSVEQDCNRGQLRSGKEISGEFVVARGDGAEVLELIEEPLDEVTFAIEREVARPLDLAISFGWDDRSDSALSEGVDERVGVVGLVANQGLRVDGLDQRFCASKIMSLAGCEHQLDGIAQGVHEHVDFGGQSAARSADGLRAVFFRAPALC